MKYGQELKNNSALKIRKANVYLFDFSLPVEAGCESEAQHEKSVEEEAEAKVQPLESQFEDALALVEDESDVLAAKELKAEVHADIAEFSEEPNNEIAQDPNETDAQRFRERQSNDMHKLENEFKLIETEVGALFFFFFVLFSMLFEQSIFFSFHSVLI